MDIDTIPAKTVEYGCVQTDTFENLKTSKFRVVTFPIYFPCSFHVEKTN